MGDENDYLNFEEGQSVHRPIFNDGSSPLSDLRNQLQVLNLGEGSKAKSKNSNFLSAPLQSIENLDSEQQKKTQSNAFASDFNSLFSNVENEGNNRNVLDVFSSIHSGFESCLDTFLNGAVKPSSSRRSLSDLESLMSDSVRSTHTEMLSTPPKSTKNEDLPLYSPFISPLDEIFGASSNNTEDVRSELLVSAVEVTETVTQTTYVEENSGQVLLKIATPYKTKTISVHGLDSEESEYSKKRDFLMQSDKKLYGKIDAKNARRKGRSLTVQMDEAINNKEILSDGKESTVVPVIQKDEDENNAVTMNIRDSEMSSKTENDGVQLLKKDKITDSQSSPTTESCDSAVVLHSILKSTEKSHNTSPKKTNTAQRILHFAETSSLATSNANTNSGPPIGTSFLSGSELNRIRESIKKDLEMLPQKLPAVRSDSAGEVGTYIHPNECPVSTFVPECTDTEGRKQVTFALSDEVIQPSAAPNSARSRLKDRKNSFKSKSSDEILESHYWCPSPPSEDSGTSPLVEPKTPVVLDSDDEEAFQSLSSSIVEEAPFVGGTPLILRDLAIQLENSWLNFSYNNISPNLERTCVVDSGAPVRSPVASTSMSETIVGEPEESDSDESENYLSVNSTIPNIEDVEYDDSQSDDTPKSEDEGGSFDVYDLEPDGTLTVSSFESACRKIREFKPDPRDFVIPHEVPHDVFDLAENVSVCVTAKKNHKATEREDVSVAEEKKVHQKWDDMDASLTVPLIKYLAAVKARGLSDGCTSTALGQTEADASTTDLSDEKNASGHFEGVSKSSAIGAQLDETIINRSAECVVEETKTSPTKSLDEIISESGNQIEEHESTGEYSSGSSTIELDENPGTKETSIDGNERPETPLANADDENPASETNISVENEVSEVQEFEGDPHLFSNALSCENEFDLPKVDLETLLDVEPTLAPIEMFTPARNGFVEFPEGENTKERNIPVGNEKGNDRKFESDSTFSDEHHHELTEVALEAALDVEPTLAPIELFNPTRNNFVELQSVDDVCDEVLAGSVKDSLLARRLKEISKHNMFVENERGNDRKFECDPTPGSSAVSDELHHELTEVNLEDLLDVELAHASMDVITIAPVTPESFVRHLNNYQPEKSSNENEYSNDDAEITRILDELDVALEDAESNIPHPLVSGEVNLVDPSVSETTSNLVDEMPVEDENEIVDHSCTVATEEYLLEDSEVEISDTSSENDYEMIGGIEMAAAVTDVANEESHHQCTSMQSEADYENPPSLAVVLELFDKLAGKLSPIREEESIVGDLNAVNTLEECSAQTMDDSCGNDAEVTRKSEELELDEVNAFPSAYERKCDVLHSPVSGLTDLEDHSMVETVLDSLDKVPENEVMGHQHGLLAEGCLPNESLNETTNLVQKSQIEELNVSVDTTRTITSRFSGEFEEREVLNASMHFRAEDTSLFSPEPKEKCSPDAERIIDLFNATIILNENEVEEIVKSNNVTELLSAEPEGSIRSDILKPVNDEFLPSSRGNDEVAAEIGTVQNETEGKETNVHWLEESPNRDVCNTSHSNQMNETRLLDTATDPQSPHSPTYESESMESSVDQSPCDLNVTRQISTESHADEQKLDVSVVREAGVRSSQDVPHVDVQEDECKNLSSPETNESQGVYENCVQNATFDLIVSPQLRNIADTKEPSEVNTDTVSDVPQRAEGDQFLNVANVNCTMISSDEHRSPTIEKQTENSGASEGVNCADLALPDPSSIVPPLSTHDSLSETKARMTVSDCDSEPAKRDPSSIADIVNRVVVENLTHSEPELSDVGSFVSDPFTPIVPRLHAGLTASSTKAAKDKIQRSLDLLLTPLRQNISRLCTPMNATHQRDLNCSDISELGPSVTLEQCEDSNKTRLVVELPTNLLDISLSTLDNMFQLGTTSAVDVEELNSGESAEKDQTTTEKAATEAYEKLAADYEQLRAICLIQRHNEEELKRAYEQSKDVIREQANRYEMFKDYMNRYISYMNDEYEKLEAKLANKT